MNLLVKTRQLFLFIFLLTILFQFRRKMTWFGFNSFIYFSIVIFETPVPLILIIWLCDANETKKLFRNFLVFSLTQFLSFDKSNQIKACPKLLWFLCYYLFETFSSFIQNKIMLDKHFQMQDRKKDFETKMTKIWRYFFFFFLHFTF